MGYYPIMLDLNTRWVALIGSGPMARQKLHGLIEAEARVRVFDTALDEAVRPFVGGRVTFIPRLPTASDFTECILVIGAHPEEAVNRVIKKHAQDAGVLVNVVDRPDDSDVVMVSQLRRGDLVIGVSTSGRGPGLARRIREALEPLFDAGWSARIGQFGWARGDIRRRLVGHDRVQAMIQLENGVMEEWRRASGQGDNT